MDILTLLNHITTKQIKYIQKFMTYYIGNIPASKKYSLYPEFDLTTFIVILLIQLLRPTNVMDIFKNIYQFFDDLIDQMKKN